MNLQPNGKLLGRKVELYSHNTESEWGYEKDQTDTFAVIYPKDYCESETYPLYVVFHSAGHDVYSAFAYTWDDGNHDIYKTPENAFAVYPDCRANMNDWWWGGINAIGEGDESRKGTEKQPVEKRIMATVKHMTDTYPIDENRIYAVGNSMGGSGSLGIALCRGDIFAAIKANVPAGVRHAADRCCLDTEAPEGFSIPEPPVVLDYSSQTDMWSKGHEVLYRGMREKKYALYGYWGEFGHANNHNEIAKYNDLIHAVPVLEIKKNEAYPVFTNASTDDKNPWEYPDTDAKAGQVNGFFRFENICDTEDTFEMKLWLLTPEEWETKVTLPESSVCDLLIRRAQNFKLAGGEGFLWSLGDDNGTATADTEGHPEISGITVRSKAQVLKLKKI